MRHDNDKPLVKKGFKRHRGRSRHVQDAVEQSRKTTTQSAERRELEMNAMRYEFIGELYDYKFVDSTACRDLKL